MGLKDNLIEDAVEEAMKQTDLEPGEVNENITKVMDTMDESYKQFEQIKKYLSGIRTTANELDESSQDVANAAIELSKASQNIGQAVNQLDNTTDKMGKNIEDLTEVMEKFQEHMPEGEK